MQKVLENVSTCGNFTVLMTFARDSSGFLKVIYSLNNVSHLKEDIKRKKMRGHLSQSDQPFQSYGPLKLRNLGKYLERKIA